LGRNWAMTLAKSSKSLFCCDVAAAANRNQPDRASRCGSVATCSSAYISTVGGGKAGGFLYSSFDCRFNRSKYSDTVNGSNDDDDEDNVAAVVLAAAVGVAADFFFVWPAFLALLSGPPRWPVREEEGGSIVLPVTSSPPSAVVDDAGRGGGAGSKPPDNNDFSMAAILPRNSRVAARL
jgi:hypothetical protein